MLKTIELILIYMLVRKIIINRKTKEVLEEVKELESKEMRRKRNMKNKIKNRR